MEEFSNTIDAENFRSTNYAWNALMLNDPWSVGYVTTLIETVDFNSKEDWEQFYYNSGKERNAKISKLDTEKQALLNDFELIRRDRSLVYDLPWDLKNLNFQMGRTQEQIRQRGSTLYEAVKKSNPKISLDECVECVRYRVVCETWNGVIVREKNTIGNLQRQFPSIEFRKTSGEDDHAYAVDYELYSNGILKCAIQIKPESYSKSAAPYLISARNANQQKNEKYKREKSATVLNVISKSSGEILNAEIIDVIKSHLR